MKYLLLILLFSDAFAEKAPLEWYTFSESDEVNKKPFSTRDFAKSIHNVTKTLDKSFGVFQKKLQTQKKNKWKPSAIATSLSLTSQGSIGLLAAEGSATAGLVWLPAQKKITEGQMPFVDTTSDNSNYTIGDTDDLSESLEPAIQFVLSNKGLQASEQEVRNTFKNAGQQLLQLAEQAPHKVTWKPIMIETFLYFSAGGRFSGVLTAASTIKVGLTWRNTARPTPFKKPGPLTHLIQGLSQELEAVAALQPFKQPPLGAGFRISVSGTGEIGVGWVSSGAQFSIILKRQESPRGSLEIKSKTIPIFRKNTAEKTSSKQTPRIFQIKSNRFKKGLTKSMKIGRFFTRRFRSVKGYWQPRILFLGFQISSSGQIALATARADISMNLVYLIPERRFL